MKNMKVKKIISIAAETDSQDTCHLYALCDDNTIYIRNHRWGEKADWLKMEFPPIFEEVDEPEPANE